MPVVPIPGGSGKTTQYSDQAASSTAQVRCLFTSVISSADPLSSPEEARREPHLCIQDARLLVSAAHVIQDQVSSALNHH